MYKKIVTLLVCLGTLIVVRAQYQPVALTGFTDDVIANGVGDASSSTTNSIGKADSNWALVAADFKATPTSSPPARALPANGIINSSWATVPFSFQLADYSAPNSLRLTEASPTGTLTFVTPRSASLLMIGMLGSHPDPPPGSQGRPVVEIDVNFTDGSVQTNGNVALHSWFVTINNSFAMAGIGRVSRGSSLNPINVLHGTATIPALPMINVAIAPANYGKTIKSLTIRRPALIDAGIGAGAIVHILAVSARAVCEIPANQPTALTFTPALNALNGTFTAAAGNPTNYLVVRYPAGATVSPPENYTSYTVGQTLGSGTVIATLAASTTNFSTSGLSAGTTYDFYVYAYNTGTACGGPTYLLSSPLKGSGTTNACTGGSGTIVVGPGGAYPSLTDALAVINTQGVGITGPTVLELNANYNSSAEVFPIMIKDNGCYTDTRSLSIRPAAGANGLKIIGNNAGPTLALTGASYVVIDGTPGGSTEASSIAVTPMGNYNSKNLNIVNTNDKGVAVMIDTNSVSNTIKFCDLQGQNNTPANMPNTIAGVVYIGNSGSKASIGNDKVVIDHCNIHATSKTTLPSMGIYVNGFANTLRRIDVRFNDSGTISNNNIYDFFHASANSTGVELTQGVNAWTIMGNSLFQTQTQYYNSGAKHKVISIATGEVTPGVQNNSVGNSFTISGNYIGGSAPECRGTPYTVDGSYVINTMEGIRVDVADASTNPISSGGFVTVPSSVQGNVIQNIFFTSGATGTAKAITDVFHGIVCQNSGRVDIGDIVGNTIGSVTQNESIVIRSANYSGANGITLNNLVTTRVSTPPAPAFLVRNNKIGGMKIGGPGTISGIYVGMPAGLALSSGTATQIVLIDSNIIGSLSLPNSIVAADAGTLPSIAGGIIIAPDVTLGKLDITHNKIANITNNSVAPSDAYLFGMVIGFNKPSASISLNSVVGNSIRKLHSASQTISKSDTLPGMQYAVTGIYANTSKAVAANISNNIIDSLVASANVGVKVAGLFFSGAATVKHTLSKNFVHSLDATAGNASSAITGIHYQAGTSDISNNMIRMGIKPNGSSITAPVSINGILSAATAANNFYFNSVYIGGTGVGATGAQNTYAFTRTVASDIYDIRNNIFVNNRSNTTSGGKHYAISFSSTNTGASPNYNVYFTKGTGGVFGYDGTKDVATYGAGWINSDVNSRTLDPQFIRPEGNLTTVDLHINTTIGTPVESAGILIPEITEDFDGNVRSEFSPTDIGADAGNFVMPSVTIGGSTVVCIGGTLTLTASSGLPSPTYTWSGPNSFSATGTTMTIPNMTAARAGIYTLTASSGSASYTATTTVTVGALPVISSIKSNSPVCTGKELNLTVTATGTGTLGYQWSGPNGFSSLQQNPVRNNVTPGDAGSYKVTVTAGVCSVSDSTTVVINQSPAIQSVSSNGPLCEGDQLNLFVTATGPQALTYQWNGANNFNAIQQNPLRNNMTFSDSGKYTVSVTSGLCSVSDTIMVVVKSRPEITSIDNNGPLCPGDSLHLSAEASKGTGQLLYEWSGPGGFSFLGQDASRLAVTTVDSGVYLLKVMDDYCSATDSTLVVVHSMVKPMVTYVNYTLSTGAYAIYQWIKDGETIPGATNDSYSITSNGDYQVAVASTDGCADTSLVHKVTDYVGINEMAAIAAKVRVYPNPATDIIYVQSPVRLNLALTNMDGRVIRQMTDVNELSLKGLAGGMYLLRITDRDGNLIKAEKVIREKE